MPKFPTEQSQRSRYVLRKIIHNRTDHQNPEANNTKNIPTESRLQRQLQSGYSKGTSSFSQRRDSIASKLEAERSLDSRVSMDGSSRFESISHMDNCKQLQQQTLKAPSKLQLRMERDLVKENGGNTMRKVASHRVAQAKDQIKRDQMKINQKMDELDEKIQELVMSQLQQIVDRSDRSSKKAKKMTALTLELSEVVSQLKNIRIAPQRPEVDMINRKICLVEKLLAGNLTEAQLRRKYYFALNANRKQPGSIGNHKGVQYWSAKTGNTETDTITKQKALFSQSTNQATFKTPKINDYESFRHSPPKPILNLQSLPRSSYKRDYLHLPFPKDQQVIAPDNSPYSPSYRTRDPYTSYHRDYKPQSSQKIDIRELDSYRDKIKVLKIDYMPKYRLEQATYGRDVSKMEKINNMTETKSVPFQKHSSLAPITESQLREESKYRHKLTTETSDAYAGDAQFQRSRIKHKQLKEFQYKLKHLFKS